MLPGRHFSRNEVVWIKCWRCGNQLFFHICFPLATVRICLHQAVYEITLNRNMVFLRKWRWSQAPAIKWHLLKQKIVHSSSCNLFRKWGAKEMPTKIPEPRLKLLNDFQSFLPDAMQVSKKRAVFLFANRHGFFGGNMHFAMFPKAWFECFLIFLENQALALKKLRNSPNCQKWVT